MKYDLFNSYGPTEATVTATLHHINQPYEAGARVPIGRPLKNTQVYILDKYLNFVPKGVRGDLYIGGVGLADGYINNDLLTENHFIENPFGSGSKLYRTGDIARWLSDDHLEFLGRQDNQVKIRGFRIELGEIEHQLLSNPVINEATIRVLGKNPDEYLVAYYISTDEISTSELQNYLSDRLPDYMVPLVYVPMEQFPLTTSGKIDRKALPDPESHSEEDFQPPANKEELQLVPIWSEVLKIPEDKISVTKSFFALGGHSLRATVLINRIGKELDIRLSLKDIFAHQDIRDLSVFMRSVAQEYQNPIIPVAERSYYPLSSAQRRMFILHEFDRESLAYNMPDAIRLSGTLAQDRLEYAFSQLIARHEILRTSFGVEDDEAVQYVNGEVSFTISYFEGSEFEISKYLNEFIRSFDLKTAPMMRVGLISVDKEDHVLLFDIHHIIHDGLSQRVLIDEFMRLYNGEALEPVVLNYKDYAVWQQEETQQEKLAIDRSFWLDLFSEPVTVLDLPTDHTRPTIRSQKGGEYGFTLTTEESTALKSLSDSAGVTMYMTLLSVFGVLLSRLSNQKDLVIGTPTSGRSHADLEEMLGMFVNTLALRLHVDSGTSFTEYLASLKERVLSSFDHQNYQYEELIDALQLARDTSRNPLFDVMFNYTREEAATFVQERGLEGLEASHLKQANIVAKFDLTLNVTHTETDIKLSFNYNIDLFKESTIVRFCDYLRRIIDEVTLDANRKIYDIDILSEEERCRLISVKQGITSDYPRESTIVSLFAQQVAKTPESIAYIFGESKMTYCQLNEESDKIASYLSSRGISNEVLVPICFAPGLEMMVAIIGILKTGAAYVPINPSHPSGLIDYMLSDMAASIIICNRESKEVLTDRVNVDVVCIEDIEVNNESAGKPDSLDIQPNQLAYVIYTSGSSGRPKGVMVEHQSLVNYIYKTKDKYLNEEITTTGTYLHLSYAFDASLTGIFIPLIFGKTTVIASVKDTNIFSDPALSEHAPYDFIKLTPSHLQILADYMEYSNEDFPTGRLVLGGEPLYLHQLDFLEKG
ncbi:MAG: condensation domain-containing protein, partial [Cyclobacteriaceae bacterium]